MTSAELKAIPVGTKITATIPGRPAITKYKLFSNWGMQTDDIGGEYVDVPAIPDKQIYGVVVEGRHPTGRHRNKTFKFIEYVNKDGSTCRKLLTKLKNVVVL